MIHRGEERDARGRDENRDLEGQASAADKERDLFCSSIDTFSTHIIVL